MPEAQSLRHFHFLISASMSDCLDNSSQIGLSVYVRTEKNNRMTVCGDGGIYGCIRICNRL